MARRRRSDSHRIIRWLWTSNRIDAKAARLALLPGSWLWYLGMSIRTQAFSRGWLESRPLPLPSVAVGNLTVGGSGKTSESLDAALPLDNGGFLDVAWNKPFGREAQQIGAALMYGAPTAYREAQGFTDQYGIETYWKIDVLEWLRITGDLQIVKNIDDDVELVPGFRLKFHKSF